jgi:hypothetical protein
VPGTWLWVLSPEQTCGAERARYEFGRRKDGSRSLITRVQAAPSGATRNQGVEREDVDDRGTWATCRWWRMRTSWRISAMRPYREPHRLLRPRCSVQPGLCLAGSKCSA